MGKKAEIEYLSKIGEDGRLHALNKPFSDPQRWQYLGDIGTLLSLLPQPPIKVLDLGVGSGWTSIFLAKSGYKVVGQDISADMISLAEENKKKNGTNNVEFVTCDYENMSFKDEFDAAVFYDSLHHAVNEKEALFSVYNALKPGGMCVTFEPGAGHSENPVSKRAKDSWGVTEKDMPPYVIINNAKNIGFRKMRVFIRSGKPVEVLSSLSRVGMVNVLKRIIRFMPWFSMRVGNIVVLIK